MLPKVNKTIVLIGLMGAGKSSVGTRLAKKLGVKFSDLDKVIEEIHNATVSEIFEKSGEQFFREQEKTTLAWLLGFPPHVIATGGGAFMVPEIREIIKNSGAVTIWLKADYEVLLERVSRKSTRPLLEKGDKAEILARLMKERYPVYEQADIIVDSDNGPHENVVKKIIDALPKKNDE